MIKELKEEIKFAIENPLLTILIIGTFTGILPATICGLILKILGI